MRIYDIDILIYPIIQLHTLKKILTTLVSIYSQTLLKQKQQLIIRKTRIVSTLKQANIQSRVQVVIKTSRSIEKRIYEHVRDIRIDNDRNMLIKHNSKTIHCFNSKDSKTLINIHNKQYRKMLASGIISNKYYPTKVSFVQLISLFS